MKELSLYEICQDCGTKCCKETGPAIVFANEVEKIVAQGKGNFMQYVEGTDCYIIPRDEKGCPYLEKGNCSIQEVKPLDCRIYPLGLNENLQLGISDDCPAKHLLGEDYLAKAEKLIAILTDEEKKLHSQISKSDGYHFSFHPTDYGLELLLDLYGCNPETIRSKTALRDYNEQLVKLIGMKAVGKTIIPEKFGSGTLHGYSAIQFIETSSVVIHIAEKMLEAHIDIFSCKPFDAKLAAQFTKEFFGARKAKEQLIER